MIDKAKDGNKDNKILYCSFCGKGQNEVRKLIAGPSVFICEECVDLCNNIIDEELNDSVSDQELNLYKPKEIKYKKGVLAKYAKVVSSASRGAVTD